MTNVPKVGLPVADTEMNAIEKIDDWNSLKKTRDKRRKARAQQIDEEEVLLDMPQMMSTEESLHEITSQLGMPVKDLRKTQEEDEDCGPILAFLHDKIIPEDEDDARYVIMVSVIHEVYNDLLFLSRKAKNLRPEKIWPPLRLVIPEKYVNQVVHKYHSELLAEHVSTNKMYDQIKDKMYSL